MNMFTKIQYNKKIALFVAFFAMVVFGVLPKISEANVSFQGMPQPVVSVSNYSQNPNTASWSNAINANPGDQISVMIYFQNMGNVPAENVRIRLTPQNFGSSNVHTFQASITSSNGLTAFGSGLVYLSQPQTLSFSGGSNNITLYNTFGNSVNPPNGTDIFGSQGLYLGTVFPGVGITHSQGAAVIRFTVGQTTTPPPPPPITYSAPNVITHNPTFVTQNTAGFSGSYSISGPVGSVVTSFQFQNNAFGGANQGNNPSGSFQYTKQNLSPGVNYSYRACATNQGVQGCGAWVPFVTQAMQQPPVPPPQPPQIQLPIINTNQPSSVAQTSAILSGTVQSPVSGTITRWFEWGTTPNPTIALPVSGTTNQAGNFSAQLSGLQSGVTYYYKACGMNSAGQVCGSVISFTTAQIQQPTQQPPQVSTTNATTTTNSALLQGYLTSAGSSAATRWFEWGQTTSLGTTAFVSGTTNQPASFSAPISGLQSGVTYYYKACGMNSAGQVCGAIMSFSTQFVQPPQIQLPIITTNQPSSVAQTSAILSGTVQSPVSGTITRWFEWGTTPNPTITLPVSGTTNQAGNFSAQLSGLQPGTTYYYKACGSNSAGQICGSVISFTTGQIQQPVQQPPQVTTTSATTTTNSALLQGSLVSAGSSAATRWFEWGQTTSLGTTAFVSGTTNQPASFSASISGLQSGVTYYYKACGMNSAGQVCGAIMSFSTQQTQQQFVLPIVSTQAPSGVGDTWATFAGTVNDTGNSPVTRWFEWGTNQNNLNQTLNVSGTQSFSGPFSQTANNLSGNQTYYYKACGSNTAGVSCGNIVSFTTSGGIQNINQPTISTYPATNVSVAAATLEGYVNNTGGSSVTRWFELGTNQNNLNQTLNVSGAQSSTGGFSRSLSGLSPNTIYYYKACGSNSGGQNCGSVYSFVTNMQQQIIPNVQLPQVTTLYPTGVSTNSATITGTATIQTGLANIWFEWGPTQNLGFVTPMMNQNQNSTIMHSAPLMNLVPNTVYYYRIVAQNSAGRIQGAVLSFQTTPSVVVPPVPQIPQPPIVQPPIVRTIIQSGGTSAYVRLTIENGADVVNAGSISAYQIEWENISNTTLNNTILRVILPQEVTYLGTTTGTYNEREHAITVNLGTLRPRDQGRFTVTTQAKTTGTSGDTIVAQTMMAFTTPGEAQHTAMNYDDDIYYNTVILGTGASLFGLGFLPNSLFGWLLLLLLILLIIWAARVLAKRENHYVRQTPPSSGLPTA
jgi:uncharacterized lipoprotein YehR (DUF1307 family)